MTDDMNKVRELAEGPLRDEIEWYAAKAYPEEACGLIVQVTNEMDPVVYWPCANLARNRAEQFHLDPVDWAQAEDKGIILAVVHSHPDASANPSQADRARCARSGLPWVIIGLPDKIIRVVNPRGYEADLVGREFCHGVQDCYTLIQDYYQRTLGIELPDFDREDAWWERCEDEGLYLKHYADAGFVDVGGPPCLHDVLLMKVASRKVNHAAVYLGGGVILHHLYGQLSERTVYEGDYQRRTQVILRHRQQLGVGA